MLELFSSFPLSAEDGRQEIELKSSTATSREAAKQCETPYSLMRILTETDAFHVQRAMNRTDSPSAWFDLTKGSLMTTCPFVADVTEWQSKLRWTSGDDVQKLTSWPFSDRLLAQQCYNDCLMVYIMPGTSPILLDYNCMNLMYPLCEEKCEYILIEIN